MQPSNYHRLLLASTLQDQQQHENDQQHEQNQQQHIQQEEQKQQQQNIVYTAAAAPAPGGGGEHRKASSPWFIYAFGAAGLFVFLTAAIGLLGTAYYNRWLLGLYACMVIVMVVAQGALLIAYFQDDSWKKHLPHDDTGQAQKMERFIEDKLAVIKWIGLAAFVLQMLSVTLACWMSSAQVAALAEEEEDQEDEVWGRRRPLLADSSEASTSGAASSSSRLRDPNAPARDDPWSKRMQDKYGLDMNQFTYDPARRQQTARQSADAAGEEGQQSRRCVIQ
jgi:hypothetical protein